MKKGNDSYDPNEFRPKLKRLIGDNSQITHHNADKNEINNVKISIIILKVSSLC